MMNNNKCSNNCKNSSNNCNKNNSERNNNCNNSQFKGKVNNNFMTPPPVSSDINCAQRTKN